MGTLNLIGLKTFLCLVWIVFTNGVLQNVLAGFLNLGLTISLRNFPSAILIWRQDLYSYIELHFEQLRTQWTIFHSCLQACKTYSVKEVHCYQQLLFQDTERQNQRQEEEFKNPHHHKYCSVWNSIQVLPERQVQSTVWQNVMYCIYHIHYHCLHSRLYCL